MKKDSVELICSVSELAGLFQSGAGVEGFLQKVVSVVAWHMKAAVCSVYLYDEATQDLVLTANQGLNPEAVGKLRLRLGEGMTGRALLELRTIREARAAESPYFKYIAGLNEEIYQGFLAVPILHGSRRVGVLVVQDPQPDYFDDNDARALRAIATQLASTIESARLLMSLHKKEAVPAVPAPQPARFGAQLVKGTAACRGIVMGRALDATAASDQWLEIAGTLTGVTEDDFLAALKKTEHQLADLQRQLGVLMADVAALIFDAHVLILKDEQFSGQMLARIRKGQPPPQVIRDVVEEYVGLFSKSPNAALREKVLDVKDLGLRLLANLSRGVTETMDYHGRIVLAKDLLPSDILKLAAQKAEGLVLIGGGTTAHISVLARSLKMPLVIVKEPIFPAGVDSSETFLILDADQGNVLINPPQDVVAHYQNIMRNRKDVPDADIVVHPTTQTRDGQRVRLMANINLLSELPLAQRLKAEGVGLYRSEFPFIVRNDIPNEEEQVRIYAAVLDAMLGHETILRTLDVGGDKILAYYPASEESNPFMGLRAIRFLLRNPEIFTQQVRAMLRAGANRSLQIMFPLVSSVDDFIQAREVVASSIGALAGENLPHNSTPRLGIMVEVPSAVELVHELAREVDFLCIGSNDLIQYTLAVDRTNAKIADLFVPYHPAVLRSLKKVADAGVAAGKPVSLCGDMASDERMIPFLVGAGIHRLSMEASRIPQVQQVIERMSYSAARRFAADLLELPTLKAVERRLSEGFSG